MNDLHETARQLILKDQIEGLSSEERELLEGHLESCGECAASAAAASQAIRDLRSIPVDVPPDLAARTQLRLYLRTSQHRPGWAMWVSFGLSWTVGVASAPWIWRAFDWAGHWAGLPAGVVKLSFILWWAMPALLTAAVLLLDRSRWEGDELWRNF